MRSDKSQVGVIRPLPRHKELRQRAALVADGASLLYVIGKDGVTGWRDVAKQRRAGDVVRVEWLSLLAEPKSAAVPMPAMDLRDAIEELEKRGCVIRETSTGLTTADPVQRKQMIDTAVRSLGFGRALPSDVARAIGAKRGRRDRDWTPWRAIIEHEWDAVRRNPTRKDALAAMVARGAPKDISLTAVHRALVKWRGDGGRTPASKRKPKN
jgi:hypothetical protein